MNNIHQYLKGLSMGSSCTGINNERLYGKPVRYMYLSYDLRRIIFGGTKKIDIKSVEYI